MAPIRGFTSGEGRVPVARDVQDAPEGLRQELVDAIYLVADGTTSPLSQQRGLSADDDLYFIIEQSLGCPEPEIRPAGDAKG
ncbi:MAG TPA: hypothetical protein VGF86_13050 [Candidatus Tumulicola sp.]|jgi:hypothetical protein